MTTSAAGPPFEQVADSSLRNRPQNQVEWGLRELHKSRSRSTENDSDEDQFSVFIVRVSE